MLHMPLNRARAALALALALSTAPALAAAREPANTGQSAEERLSERPAGLWQGTWRVVREDARLRTRGAQELLELSIWHDRGAAQAQVDWLALRAICLDPASPPCEWVGASGQSAVAAAHARGLSVLLPVSADEGDPFVLSLFGAPAKGRAAVLKGLLFSARGELLYKVRAERVQAPD